MDTTGKPILCDINKIMDAAEEYIRSDDGQKGMWILNNLPAYYMDHYPARAYEIKKSYYNKLWTIADYLSDDFDKSWNEEKALHHYHGESQWRAEYVKSMLKTYNDAGGVLHIIELGAANYWLPVGLKADGFKFTYQSIGPDVAAIRQAKEHLADIWCEDPTTPTLFICMEVIEHCMDPMDIFHYYCKLPREADYIIMTTPRYMMGPGIPGIYDWRSKDQNHVKTWGCDEFKNWSERTFNLHNFYAHDRQHLIIRGILKSLEKVTSTVKSVNDQEV